MVHTTKVSHTDITVLKIAHGLMLMTWKDPVVPEEQCFASIKAGLDLAGPGEKVILNSGEFYGVNPREANLHLLARFFDKFPEYREKAFISVKGGAAPDSLNPDGSEANLKASVEGIYKAIGNRKIDLFEPARIDAKYTVEHYVKVLDGLRNTGKYFDHIGLSEVSAATLRRGQAVAPIALCEIEISPWSYEPETRKVIEAGKELGVNVLGYSPIGRGFLTGQIKKESLSQSDFRFHHPRFQDEAAAANQKLVDDLTVISQKKNITNAQLCIAWVASLGDHVIPLPGSSKDSRTLENFKAGEVVFSAEEKKGLDELIGNFVTAGERYPKGLQTWT